jgi:hypothetical protein
MNLIKPVNYSKYSNVVFIILSAIISMTASSTVWAVEFEDYDYSKWSQEVTGCDTLAAHGT